MPDTDLVPSPGLPKPQGGPGPRPRQREPDARLGPPPRAVRAGPAPTHDGDRRVTRWAPTRVRDQYRTTANRETRSAVWTGRVPRTSSGTPCRGGGAPYPRLRCGGGRLAERIRTELGQRVLALDASAAIANVCRGRGLDTVVGDLRRLPFASGSLDAVVAPRMLYHVAPVPERARGVRASPATSGRLRRRHQRPRPPRRTLGTRRGRARGPFGRESGEGLLTRHVDRAARHDLTAEVHFAPRLGRPIPRERRGRERVRATARRRVAARSRGRPPSSRDHPAKGRVRRSVPPEATSAASRTPFSPRFTLRSVASRPRRHAPAGTGVGLVVRESAR